MLLDTYPVSSNSLEKFYYNDGNQFGQQYKEHLVDYNQWDEQEHAEQWLVFPENVGPHLSIDETGLSNGELYPDIKKAYGLTHSLRMIFTQTKEKGVAYTRLARWFNGITDSDFKSFNTISATEYSHYPEILNFFDNRSTNASAESFNAKIKSFRATLRGVTDTSFFLFRLAKIYA